MGWPGARRTYSQGPRCEPARAVADHYSFRFGHGIGAFRIGVDPIGGVRPGFVHEIQSLPPLSDPVSSPLPVRSDPAVGFLTVNGAPVPPAAIGAGQQTGYVPFYAPDGRIGHGYAPGDFGGLTIGRSAIGNMGRPFHGRQHVEMRGLDPAGPLYPVIIDDPS